MAETDSTAAPPPVEYRDIHHHPGYRVGSDGSVWTCWRRRSGRGRNCWVCGDEWRRLAARRTRKGYLVVRIASVEGRRRTCFVHRLVLAAFSGEGRPDLECRHGNGDRADNRYDNLSWGTALENAADRQAHGHTARGEALPSSRLTAAAVRRIIRRLQDGEGFRKLAREYGVRHCTIARIAHRHGWKHVWASVEAGET